jgi:hypothetical protein
MVRSLVRRRLWAIWLVALLIASGMPSTCGCLAMAEPGPQACHSTPTCCEPGSAPSITSPSSCCDLLPANGTTTLCPDFATAGLDAGRLDVGLVTFRPIERSSHAVRAVRLRSPLQVVLRI